MTYPTSSYAEKLLDPRWQKKRLEALNAAGFACSSCAATTITLHVHHKEYVKGREPWEYALDELEVLCAVCHSERHDPRRPLTSFLELLPASAMGEILALVAGYACAKGLFKVDEIIHLRPTSASSFYAGAVAAAIRREGAPTDNAAEILKQAHVAASEGRPR
jgi:hypothetical protein